MERDDAHAAADVHELVHLLERVIHDHDARRFRSHVTVLSDGHANRRGHHGGGVVDAVADVERLCFCSFSADESELLFGTLLRVDLGDADLLCEVMDLRLTVAGHDHHARELVLRTQMLHEGAALRARGIAKPQSCRVALIDHHYAFESTGERGKLIGAGNILRQQFVPACDHQGVAGDGAAKPLARLLAHFGGLGELNASFLRCRENRASQRMLRVALQTRHERQHFLLLEAGGDELLGQRRLAIRERPGLVEDRDPALGDLFEHHGALHDDRPAGAEGNRADDGDGNGEQQRARRGNHQHREKANRLSADRPREDGDDQRHRSINRAEAISEPSQARSLRLRLAHDFHDLGVARISGELSRADGQH